ncbi:MAG: pyridoxal-phosphate dependent enzyme [Acidimicrobiales bacterium]
MGTSELDVDLRRYALATDVVDAEAYQNAVVRFSERNITLPTFAQLADPSTIPASARAGLVGVGADAADAQNLWRVHWFNDADRTGSVSVPGHLVIPPELSGVEATIVLALGDRFPMIRAHKVLAAYACLAPRVVTGQFDPVANRAIWPSTGNYARGGIAISRLMASRGVAVLPEGMSQERFDWLDEWVENPEDIIRTYGTESNVKEIYDECRRLAAEPDTVVLNQFSEYSNYLGHYAVTGVALGRVFEHIATPEMRLRAFVSASGSAGTLAAGDRLKDDYGAEIVAVEALECPTMLYNGYGEHNIQGIGDKHIPLIHNVMNSDWVCAVSDRSTDGLGLVFNSALGQQYLTSRLGVAPEVVQQLPHLGLSSICNLLASIQLAKREGYGREDVIVTVATDGAEMYGSEREKLLASRYSTFDETTVANIVGQHLQSIQTEHLLPLDAIARDRVFNLGYYTWVEQQDVPFEDFEARRSQTFWRALRSYLEPWDVLIEEFNGRTAAL